MGCGCEMIDGAGGIIILSREGSRVGVRALSPERGSFVSVGLTVEKAERLAAALLGLALDSASGLAGPEGKSRAARLEAALEALGMEEVENA